MDSAAWIEVSEALRRNSSRSFVISAPLAE